MVIPHPLTRFAVPLCVIPTHNQLLPHSKSVHMWHRRRKEVQRGNCFPVTVRRNPFIIPPYFPTQTNLIRDSLTVKALPRSSSSRACLVMAPRQNKLCFSKSLIGNCSVYLFRVPSTLPLPFEIDYFATSRQVYASIVCYQKDVMSHKSDQCLCTHMSIWIFAPFVRPYKRMMALIKVRFCVSRGDQLGCRYIVKGWHSLSRKDQ